MVHRRVMKSKKTVKQPTRTGGYALNQHATVFKQKTGFGSYKRKDRGNNRLGE